MTAVKRRRVGSARGAGVVGLDPSLTATGIADTAGKIETLKPTELTGPARLVWIRDAVVARCRNAELVVIEGYGYESGARRDPMTGKKVGGSQAHSLGELGGVLRVALYEAGVRFLVVVPQAIKIIATGKGNVAKLEVIKAAIRRLDLDPADDNQADAAWARVLGLAALGRCPVTLPQSHMRALDSLDWSAD